MFFLLSDTECAGICDGELLRYFKKSIGAIKMSEERKESRGEMREEGKLRKI